jgi:hypothetical protein
MPVKFINAPYYNLVNNKLLNPINLNKYIMEFNKRWLEVVENPNLQTFTLSPIVIEYYWKPNSEVLTRQLYIYNNNRADFNQVWQRIPRGVMLSHISTYIQNLYNNKVINTEEQSVLTKLIKNNTYKIKDKLINAMCNIYFNKFIAPMVSKYLAINKIKRNAIYNTGLGLKLAVREYSKDF